ncbi:MAG: hypothetical protein ACR2HH_09890 [Chthoniobacterales bacterium]
MRDHLLPAGIRPERFTGVMLTEAVVEMVKAGLGITVLPRWSAANHIFKRQPFGEANYTARPLQYLVCGHPKKTGQRRRDKHMIGADQQTDGARCTE